MKLKLLAVSLNLASIASEEVSTAAVQSSPAPTTVAPTTATAATANNDQETTVATASVTTNVLESDDILSSPTENVVSEIADPVNNQDEVDTNEWYKHYKDPDQLDLYMFGSSMNIGYLRNVQSIEEPKYYTYFLKKVKTYLGENRLKRPFLPNGKEFYREQFNKFDTDQDGFISYDESVARDQYIDNLVNPNLDLPLGNLLFTNTLTKTIANFYGDQFETGALKLDYNTFVKYLGTTDLMDGYGLWKMHDNYARVNGRSPENGYICIAEYGWMARQWVNLLGVYNGPYEGDLKSYDFRTKYSITHDGKYYIHELAAWKARVLNQVIFGRPIY